MKKSYIYILLSFIIFISIFSSASIKGSAENDAEAYLYEFDFSDFSNWTSGFFTESGTKYSSATIRTLDYLIVDSQATYSIQSSNDSFSITVCEYNSDYTFLVSNTFKSGAEFAPSKDTTYIGVYISSTTESKYNAFKIAFEEGSSITFNILENYDDSLEAVDLTNTSLFKKGQYIKKVTSARTYAKCTNTSHASLSLFDSYKLVDASGYYSFTAPSDDYKLVLVEQNEDLTALSEITIANGSSYIPRDGASGVALSIINTDPSYTIDNIKSDLASGLIYFGQSIVIIEEPGEDTPSHDSPDEPEPYQPGTDENLPIIVGPPIASTDAHSFVESMRAGWNLGNTFDSYSSTSLNGKANLGYEYVWGNVETTPEMLQYVADCGFDTIRIPVSWSYHTYVGPDGNYHVYESWLQRVSQIVNMALDAGLKVIINSHHDHNLFFVGTDDATFATVKGNFQNIWTDVATYFKDYNGNLLFEASNEMDNVVEGFVYSDLAATQNNELNQLFVDTVRGTGSGNTDRLLVIPTLMDKYGAPFMEAYRLPTDSANDRLIITVHMYSKEFDQSLDYNFTSLENYSNKIGAPIIIGEYGYTTSFTIVDRKIALSNYVARAAEHGLKTIVWDNGKMNQYGLINRADPSSSLTDLISAIVNPSKNEGNAYIDITNTLIPELKLAQNTGAAVTDIWWGSMLSSSVFWDTPLDTNAKYLKVKCVNDGDAFSRNVHYVNFYDASGNVLKMNSIGYPGYDYYTYAIPQGATLVKICIFSSKFKTSKSEYLKYIEDGNLKLLVGYVY